jgi:hypothetical protein
MSETIASIRILHIVAGLQAFVVAPAALVTAKGGLARRRWGKLDFWSMAVVVVSAAILATWRPLVWLALVAVFSFYSALSGYRALSRKRPHAGVAANALDWLAAGLTLTASAALFALGVAQPIDTWARISTIAMVLGLRGVAVATRDLVSFTWPSRNRQAWWFSHMTGMLGSWIATVSAFSVVNFTFLPLTAHFLWPSSVGVRLIFAWIAYYRVPFSRRVAGAVAA